jgi:colanic acid biosynthesis glycosyl transferase WcaI
MNILVVSQYFWPENFRINDLTAELVRRGHKVTVLTGQPNYPEGFLYPDYFKNKSKYNDYEGATIVRVPIITRGKSKLKLLLNYISFALSASTFGIYRLRHIDFDSIFVFEPSPITVGLPAVFLRKIKNAPMVFWVLDLWPQSLMAVGVLNSRVLLRVLGFIVSYIYNRSDLILGQSKSFILQISKYSNHNRIEYFPSWAEPIFEVPKKNYLNNKKYNHNFNILFAGNIGEAQNFPAILDAIELLKDNANIHWTIVGGGRKYKWLKSEIEHRGLNSFITMSGRHSVEEMPKFFQDADALLVSLKDDPIFSMTIPGKVQAYLISGKPILAMLNGEGAKIIEKSNSGIVCGAGQSQCLANAAKKLCEMSYTELNDMGQRGVELSMKEFNRTKLIDFLEDRLIVLTKKKIDYSI